MNRKILIIGIVVAALIVAGIAYSTLAPSGSSVIVRLVTTNPPAEGGLILPQNEKRNWDPDLVELKMGVPITIVVVNNDDIEKHQFSIPEFNVVTPPIPPFESAIIEFTPTKTGTFKFIDPRPEETYTYTDYRGVEVHQVVNHSVEVGVVEVKP